jgi:DNA (cytosine-5)-methyltransferase 1
VSQHTGCHSRLKYASVCDGIGAAHVAWQPLGWQCQWTSEIEPFPAAVVEHHYGFRNLGDMTAITEEMLDAPVDLLVGGTPCQSFSVAGLRGGLADPRGNLALRFVQLAAVMQPKWIVWENVPGVLSSGKGRDFGTFLGALGELGYGFAYRVLDAQWFGVAQRRRRVFVVGYLGDWRRSAAVLFERESVFGDSPTRGATGQGITSSPQGIAGNVSSKWAKGTGGPAGDECYNLVAAYGFKQGANHSGACGGLTEDCEPPLTCGQDHNLIAFHPTQDPISSTDGSTHAMGCGSKQGCCTQAVAFKPGQSEAAGGTFVTVEFAPTIQSQNNGSTAVPAVAYDILGTLATNGGKETDCHTALRSRPPGQSEASTTTVVAALTASGRGVERTGESRGQDPVIAVGMAVRRLTPRECERLQGFPDDYTLVEYRKKPAADGPRYRALGNSMAVPVMRWIGERIAKVDSVQ